MKQQISKRVAALMLAGTMVASQSNMPANLIHINNLGTIITKAAGEDTTNYDFSVGIEVENTINHAKIEVPFFFNITDKTNREVSLANVENESYGAAGSFSFDMPSSIIYDGIEYTITSIDGNSLDGLSSMESITIPHTVRSIGQNAFGSDLALKTVTFADSEISCLESIENSAFIDCIALEEITLPANLMKIGDKAFSGCSKLKTVTCEGTEMPLEIGNSAFAGLTQLETVLLPDTTVFIGKEAFFNCKNLKAVTIPSALTTIKASTFEECNALVTTDVSNYRAEKEAEKDKNNTDESITVTYGITFSDKIETIEEAAFKNCTQLESINLSNTSLTTLSKEVFSGCSNIQGNPQLPDTIGVIEDQAFYNCSKLSRTSEQVDNKFISDKFVMPKELMSIGVSAFEGCTSLTSIDWNDCSVNTLKDYAFKNCTNLDPLTIPPNITTIPKGLCAGCVCLGRLNLPTTVTSIGESAFESTNMAQIHYYKPSETANDAHPDKYTLSQLKTIGKNAFKNAAISIFKYPSQVEVIEQGTFQNCQLSDLTFNNVITTIGISAFEGCKLESIEIPDTVTSLQASAFKSCTSLTSATITNETITKLANSMFEGCTKLEQVTLPKSVVELDSSVFSGCTKLTSLTMPGFDQITSIGASCFANCTSLTGINDSTGALNFPATFKTIGKEAFLNCSKLVNVDLSKSNVSVVSQGAFSGTNLNSVAFPTTLTKIDHLAFVGCSLNNLVFLPLAPSEMIAYADAFRDATKDDGDRYITSNPKITVPANKVDDYIKFFEGLGFSFTKNQINPDAIIDATNITLDKSKLETYIGGTYSLKCSLNAGATENIIFTSSNDKIVRVDGDGKITGINLGTATITAKTSTTGLEAKCEVTVSPNTNSKQYVKDPIITINPDYTQIGSSSEYNKKFFVGDTITVLTPTTVAVGSETDDAITDYLTWSLEAVDSENAVTTTVDGEFTIVSNGYIEIRYNQDHADIKALKYTNKPIKATIKSLCATQKQLTISIAKMLDSIAVKKATDTLSYSKSTINAPSKYFTFNPSSHGEKINWSSSNTAVATVDENGMITPAGIGTTTITATGDRSATTASVELTFTNDITSVSSSDKTTSYTAIAGQSINIVAVPTYTTAGMASNDTLTFESSNPEVLTVASSAAGANTNLAVTTLKPGNAKINVYNSAKKNVGSFTVTVSAIKLKNTTYKLYTKGAYKTANIEIDTTLPADAPVSYAMADAKSSKVASVSATGVITAKKAGTATINVTAYGSTTTCTVNVTASNLTFSLPGSTYKKKNKTYSISKSKKKVTISVSPNYIMSDKKKVTYKSSKKSVATISKKGVLKLKKTGSTTLTITCNKVKYKFKIKVTK